MIKKIYNKLGNKFYTHLSNNHNKVKSTVWFILGVFVGLGIGMIYYYFMWRFFVTLQIIGL